MKIKTKLQITTVVSLIVALVIGSILFFSAQQVNEGIKKDMAADEIIRGLFELNILTNEYLMHHEERAKTQWQLKHDSIKRLLEEIEVKSPEKMVLLKRIRESHMDIKNIFSQMVLNYEGYRDEKSGVSQELNEMLVGNLVTKSRSIVFDAYQLAQISSARLVVSQQRAYFLVVLFTLIIAVVVATVSFSIHRGVVKPIRKLHEGTEIIGAGNLNYKVGTMAKDEVGQLSRAFDRMTIELKESFGGLEKEIAKRKGAEEHIRKLNRVYAVLSDINQAIVRIREPQSLFDKACRIAVETGGFRMAWIGLMDESSQKIQVVAHVGGTDAYFETLDISLRGKPLSYCPVDCALRERRHAICHVIPHDAHMAPCQKIAFQQGFHSSASFPLIVSGKIRGTFNLYAGEPDFFDEEEIKLLDELALDISFAMEFTEQEAERKRAEEKTRRLATVVKDSNDAITIQDFEGRITAWNRGAELMYGFSEEEALQMNIGRLTSPGKEAEQKEFTRRLIAGEAITSLETQRVAKDGRILDIWMTVTKLVDDTGKPIGIASTERDITERKRAEQEMRTLEDQFRQSQKMEAIGSLAGGIAHDFNNLLTIIKGYSQLSLMELKEGDPLKPNIEEVQKAADRAAGLTRQLLAFSRRQVMEMRVLDPNTLLRDLDKMLRRIIGEDIELVTLLADDLGTVKADAGQIEQVVLNLAVNARDAMQKGGKLTIETANVELDENYARNHVAVKSGPYVMLSVSDTGVGMTPEVRDRVFEPFFTTKEKGKGTGLGLSTVYGIVKQSGGNIWVYSEPGKGTTFKIYLSRVDEPLEEVGEKVVQKEFTGRGETILVVEDEEKVRQLTVQILRRQGYTVLEASQGNEASHICEQHKGPIHLMVMDVVMPGMNGRELAKSLEPHHPEMKVLYMSGYTDNAIVHHGILEKGLNFIQKPFTLEGLLRKVREVLDK